MRIVKESLFEKFTEDSDPIKDMGIGINPDNAEVFVPYIIDRLPEILKVEKIPIDILGAEEGPYISRQYASKINEWMVKIFKRDFKYSLGNDSQTIKYNIWSDLHDMLRSMGFNYSK